MTTIATIIADAYREGNLIAQEASPTSNQETEGLRRLNRILSSYIGDELGTELTDVPVGKNGVDTDEYIVFFEDTGFSYIPSNTRIVANPSAATTLYLDPSPRDGARMAIVNPSDNLATFNIILDGNGRQIEDAPFVTLNTNGLEREWFYRGDVGSWVRTSNLTTTDEQPFPAKYDDLLITRLAMRLSGPHGNQLNSDTMDTYMLALRRFKAQYSQIEKKAVEAGLLNVGPLRKWVYLYDDVSSTTRFNKGIY